MKAFIFAAGLGTRLRPLTDHTPKALVEIQGKPLLEHVLQNLMAAGFDDFVINIHHFGQQIIDFLESRQNFGVEIRISDEREQLLDTGGAIKKARPLLGNEPFLIHNVDIFSNADTAKLMDMHLQAGNEASLLVSKRTSSRQLLFEDNLLCAWRNTQTDEVKGPYKQRALNDLQAYAFSGIHVFSPKLFDRMDLYPDKFSIIDFYLDACADCRIGALQQDGLRLLDVGKIDQLDEAQRFISER